MALARPLRTLAAMAAGAALAFASTADAESLSRGEALYAVLGCVAGNCHGTTPSANLNNVLNGAGSPAAIEHAAFSRTEMNHLYATFVADQTAALDLAAWLRTVAAAPPPPPPGPTGATTTIVEYVHAGFGHYFITGFAADMEALDSGRIAGWARTGKSFKAYVAAEPMLSTVCRFFTTSFAPKSSHFYTAMAAECAGLRDGSRDWLYEGDAFHVPMPDASGACPSGSSPVFRVYNNGQGGAPNHRYTADAAVRAAMISAGWAPEGYGPQGVAFCSPG
jgi:hypothetical protein